MALKLGSSDISDVYVGSTAVQKVYLGTTEVWAPAASAVLYHATGTGDNDSTGQLSFSITLTETCTVFVWATHLSSGTPSMTIGGAAMTLVDSQGANNNNSSGRLFLFRKDNVAAGTHAIASTGMSSYINGNAVAYRNVGSVSAVTKKFTISGAMSFPVTLSAGQIAMAGWQHSYGGLASMSGGTQRYYVVGPSSFVALAIRDMDVSGTLTASGVSGLYGGAGMMVVLSP